MHTTDSLNSVEREMRSGDFQTALLQLALILKSNPNDTDALYLSAVCHRYLKNYDAALSALQALQLLMPDHSRALQEQGHLFLAMRQSAKALEAYSRATKLNPALEASWRGQLQLLEQQGHSQQAAAVKAHLTRLIKSPKPLRLVTELIAQGKLLKAEGLCRKFLQKNPTNVEAMRQLAAIGSRLGVLDDAEFLLESALQIEQNNAELRIDYLQILRKRQKFVAALTEAKKLLDLQPHNSQYQSLYAIECMQVGDYDTAIAFFDTVLERLPGEPATLTSQGHAFKTSGDQSAAVNAYRQALMSNPQHGEAWYSLANLKTVTFTEQDIQLMLEQLRNSLLVSADHVYLNFALGKAYEDRNEFEKSFKHYAEGNRIKKAQSRYNAEQMTSELQSQQQFCNTQFAAKLGADGHPAPDPIFIVGLPRSGSTLLEQILSSHSMVDGTLELPNILSLAHKLRRGEQLSSAPLYPENLPSLSVAQRQEFGKQYIQDTQIHRQGAPFFIDKMPNNFRHIGLIKSILPNAKIIDARREPMACCYSGFKQLFAEGQEFSYDLTDIALYYRDYQALMTHWDSLFPKQILRIHYENVVDDLATEVARMLDYCGLPHEDRCLEFHSTKRAVRTASSEQVRQPIYRSGLEQWRHYEAWLTPLKQVLKTTPTTPL